MTSELYVFAPLAWPAGGRPLQNEHVLTGKITWADGTGVFRYAPDWLRHKQAYALDPVNLPLVDGPMATTANDGVHGVLADAGPDTWGRRLLELQRGEMASPLEALRLTNGSGTGALLFSGSRTRPAPRRGVVAEATLEQLEQAAREVAAGETVSKSDLERVYVAGSSLGGARPKVNVQLDGRPWIAKFQKADDDIDIPKLEAACLTLGSLAGLEVPDHRLVSLNGRSALLVARFDRPADRHVHYLSLHALLSPDRISANDTRAPMGSLTYGGLAATCRRIGVEDAGAVLFRRMMFNVRIANTDDHLRNHGLLFDGVWRHAPSFDLVSMGGPSQAIGIGVHGRARTVENAMSDVGRFGLSDAAASAIDAEVVAGLEHARSELERVKLPPADIERVLGRFKGAGST